MDRKKMSEENGKFCKEYYSVSFKQVSIYINESQKSGLISFFESINFYGYTILKDLESNWSKKMKHMNSHAWPGSDCLFIMSVREEELGDLLKKLKEYRMTLSENIVFALGIIPVERIIPDLYNFDV